MSTLIIIHLPEDQIENTGVHSSTELQNTLPDCQVMPQRQSNLQAPLFETTNSFFFSCKFLLSSVFKITMDNL